MSIPVLDAAGMLPPGRFLTTLDEVEDRFVANATFGGSATRRTIWGGFLEYIGAWRAAEESTAAPGRALLGVWLAGSFISAKIDPSDLDCTPVLDVKVMEATKGRPGHGDMKKLVRHRDGVRSMFHVEVFPYKWTPVRSSLFPATCSQSERDSLCARGALDAWWQRVRPPGPERAPEPSPPYPERGYLEVIL
ncbi:DUF6932 family protein [Actinomyces provencensis]|uniref:DUF6932 family protein n=1 Tax=Actinomyces provencensis TaxID=1720198 RepID=UPI00096AB154